MTDQSELCRSEFEAEATKRGDDISKWVAGEIAGLYCDLNTQEYWEYWQACWQSKGGQTSYATYGVPLELMHLVGDKAPQSHNGWMPISECPADLKEALIYGGKYHEDDGYGEYDLEWPVHAYRSYSGDWRRQANGHDREYYYEPTHWQPLPKAPTNNASEGSNG